MFFLANRKNTPYDWNSSTASYFNKHQISKNIYRNLEEKLDFLNYRNCNKLLCNNEIVTQHSHTSKCIKETQKVNLLWKRLRVQVMSRWTCLSKRVKNLEINEMLELNWKNYHDWISNVAIILSLSIHTFYRRINE